MTRAVQEASGVSSASMPTIRAGRFIKSPRSLAIPVVFALVAACGATPAPLTAKAQLKDKDGATVATIALAEKTAGAGVTIALTITKLPAGQHGWHVHTVGKCDPPDFTTAGTHFNPDGHQHGALNPQGPHAGDLGNLTVSADGTAKVEFLAKAVTLEPGKSNSLFKAEGTAIVIHTNPDDEKTDPSGNSGGRIACGVVTN